MHTMRKITKEFLRRVSGAHPFTMSVNFSKLRRGRLSLAGLSRRYVDHSHGLSLSGRCILPGSVRTPECWALVGHSLLLGHEGFKGVSIGEVPVDVGLAQVREQLLQDDFPSLFLSRAPETFDPPRRTSSCQVEPIFMCRVVGATWLVRAVL